MGTARAWMGGLGIGAAIMYLFDPQRGRRRRSIARDKMLHNARIAAHGMDVGWRDLANRMRGSMAEARLHYMSNGVADPVLEARVRSRIGRVTSHPHAIKVHCRNGTVEMEGPVLSHEVNDLLRVASSVPGVHELAHSLDIHEHADIPSLQGGRQRAGYPNPLTRARWKPATRLVIGATGAMAAIAGMRRGGLLGSVATMAASMVLARALSNERMQRLLGMEDGADLFEIQKSVHIAAPPRAVFAFWDGAENFPMFMRNVHEVVDLGNGRSHWTVAGPAGTTVGWQAEVVERVENHLLAWRTVEGSLIEHAGVIRFMEAPDGGTRVEIRLSYTPPGGAIGHAVATLFGADPKHELDADLARMKTMMETGKAARDAARQSDDGQGIAVPIGMPDISERARSEV